MTSHLTGRLALKRRWQFRQRCDERICVVASPHRRGGTAFQHPIRIPGGADENAAGRKCQRQVHDALTSASNLAGARVRRNDSWSSGGTAVSMVRCTRRGARPAVRTSSAVNSRGELRLAPVRHRRPLVTVEDAPHGDVHDDTEDTIRKFWPPRHALHLVRSAPLRIASTACRLARIVLRARAISAIALTCLVRLRAACPP